jgi:hypothetical protein
MPKADNKTASPRRWRLPGGRRPALAGLFLCLCVCRADAEDIERLKARIAGHSWFTRGAIYLDSAFSLDGLGYSSNIYRLAMNKAPDWTSDMALSMGLSAFIGNRFALQVRETPHYAFYAQNPEERTWGNELELSVHGAIGHFNLSCRVERNSLFVQPTFETGIRSRVIEKRQLFSVDYGAPDYFFVNLQVTHEELGYRNRVLGFDTFDSNRLMSREEWGTGLSLNRRIFTRTFVALSGRYFKTTFPFMPSRDRQGGECSLQLRFPEIGRIEGSVSCGFRIFVPLRPQYRNYARPFGNGQVSMALLDRLRLRLHYQLDNQYSLYRPDFYFDIQAAGAGGSCFLNSRLRVDGDFTLENRDYRALGRSERVWRNRLRSFQLGLVLTMSEKWETGITGVLTHSNSSDPLYRQDADRVGMFLHYVF